MSTHYSQKFQFAISVKWKRIVVVDTPSIFNDKAFSPVCTSIIISGFLALCIYCSICIFDTPCYRSWLVASYNFATTLFLVQVRFTGLQDVQVRSVHIQGSNHRVTIYLDTILGYFKCRLSNVVVNWSMTTFLIWQIKIEVI